MIFEIESKDEAGKIIFSGSLNKNEATFLLNVGVNYLAAKGALELIARPADGDGFAHPESGTVQ